MKEKTKIVFATIFLIAIVAAMGIFPALNQITGKVVYSNTYAYTRAICDENNFCQDYKITCVNNTLVSKEPITGATITHNKNWEDPRKDSETYEHCREY